MVVSLSLVKVRVVGSVVFLTLWGYIGGSTVQCSTVQYEVEQHSTVHGSTVLFTTVAPTTHPPLSRVGWVVDSVSLSPSLSLSLSPLLSLVKVRVVG